jgi:hypothetical protein
MAIKATPEGFGIDRRAPFFYGDHLALQDAQATIEGF